MADSDPEKFMFVSTLKREDEHARRLANAATINTEELEVAVDMLEMGDD